MTWSRGWLEISGPLTPYAAGFTEWLGHNGYVPTTVRTHQRRMIHLSRWMQTAGIDCAEFGSATVAAFIAAQSAAGRFSDWKAGSWAALLQYLRAIGVPLVDPPASVVTAVDALLTRYGEYEATERGLATWSIERNVRALRLFVECRMRDSRRGLEQLTAAEVTAFVVEQARLAPRSLAHLVPALRSLLRYLHVTGVIPVELASAVPTVARWKLAGLPKALPEDQVRLLLASCDSETEIGQRDLAIMAMMWRLGLRIGEVAALRLEDIDWRRGELIITGKGPRCERLPLPSDVGRAIVSYLTGRRPETDARHVFVCAKAPHGSMFRNTVTNVVARAARRAGLGVVHAHRLRYSAATAMLGIGESPAADGEVHDDQCSQHRRRDPRYLLLLPDHSRQSLSQSSRADQRGLQPALRPLLRVRDPRG